MELSQVVNPGFIRPWHYLVIVPQTVRKIFSWTCWQADWLTDWLDIKMWIFLCWMLFSRLAGWLAGCWRTKAGWAGLTGQAGRVSSTHSMQERFIDKLDIWAFSTPPAYPPPPPPPSGPDTVVIMWSDVMWRCRTCRTTRTKLFLTVTLNGCASLASRYLAWSRWRLIRVWLPITCLDSD